MKKLISKSKIFCLIILVDIFCTAYLYSYDYYQKAYNYVLLSNEYQNFYNDNHIKEPSVYIYDSLSVNWWWSDIDCICELTSDSVKNCKKELVRYYYHLVKSHPPMIKRNFNICSKIDTNFNLLMVFSTIFLEKYFTVSVFIKNHHHWFRFTEKITFLFLIINDDIELLQTYTSSID